MYQVSQTLTLLLLGSVSHCPGAPCYWEKPAWSPRHFLHLIVSILCGTWANSAHLKIALWLLDYSYSLCEAEARQKREERLGLLTAPTSEKIPSGGVKPQRHSTLELSGACSWGALPKVTSPHYKVIKIYLHVVLLPLVGN